MGNITSTDEAALGADHHAVIGAAVRQRAPDAVPMLRTEAEKIQAEIDALDRSKRLIDGKIVALQAKMTTLTAAISASGSSTPVSDKDLGTPESAVRPARYHWRAVFCRARGDRKSGFKDPWLNSDQERAGVSLEITYEAITAPGHARTSKLDGMGGGLRPYNGPDEKAYERYRDRFLPWEAKLKRTKTGRATMAIVLKVIVEGEPLDKARIGMGYRMGWKAAMTCLRRGLDLWNEELKPATN